MGVSVLGREGVGEYIIRLTCKWPMERRMFLRSLSGC